MDNNQESKPVSEPVEKDYFKSLDTLVDQSSEMNTSPLEGTLGKYRNMVVIAALLVAGLVLTDHYLSAKVVVTITALIVVVHAISSVKLARSVANKGVGLSVRGAQAVVDKAKEMKQKKEASKAAATEQAEKSKAEVPEEK